ncbi:hypothetical protein PG995_004324 [Apiospora arundinis]
MESHGQPANGTESENLQRLDVRSSVSPVGATKGELIGHATSQGTAGVGYGTARTSQLEYREICHDTEGVQVLPELIDESFPSPPENLWHDQLALVKDSRAQEHPIHRILIDTGAAHSAITLAKAKRLGLKRLPTLKKLTLTDGSILEAVRFTILRLLLPDIGLGEVQVHALILPRLPKGRALVIGLTEIMKHNIAARIVERQYGWEQSTDSAFAMHPEPSHDLACTLLTFRSPGELATEDGASGALLTDMTDAEQREDDAKQLEDMGAETDQVSAIREKSMATVPSSSSSARSSTESSWPETCDEGSQDTDLTTPSTTPK